MFLWRNQELDHGTLSFALKYLEKRLFASLANKNKGGMGRTTE